MAFSAPRATRASAVASAARLLRPGNALIAAAAVATGAYVAAGPALSASALPVAAAAGAAFAYAAAGNVLNDLHDVAIDRRAHPDRPLVTGAIPLRAARFLLLALLLAGAIAAAAAGLPTLLFSLGALLLLFAYEYRLKALGLPGNLAVAALTGAPFVLGALVVGAPFALAVWCLALLAALATLGREIVKDVEDMDADLGRRTLPQRVGAPRARHVARAALLGAVALSPIPFLAPDGLGAPYLLAVIPADALFLWAAFATSPTRASAAAKGAMVVGLAAFLAGRAMGGRWTL